jgi:hypothetical protein
LYLVLELFKLLTKPSVDFVDTEVPSLGSVTIVIFKGLGRTGRDELVEFVDVVSGISSRISDFPELGEVSRNDHG